MAANVTASYDVQVNHSVVFKCTLHDRLLAGIPEWFVVEEDGETHFKIDTSQMWCDHPDVEDQDEEQDCQDGWKITIDALQVAT